MAFVTALFVSGEGFCVFPLKEWKENRDTVINNICATHGGKPYPSQVINMLVMDKFDITVHSGLGLVVMRHPEFHHKLYGLKDVTEEEVLEHFEKYRNLFGF